MHDLTEAIAAAHAALDERFYPGPTEDMVVCIVEAAAPIIAAKAWDEGFGVGSSHGIAYQSGDDTALPPPSGLNPYRARTRKDT